MEHEHSLRSLQDLADDLYPEKIIPVEILTIYFYKIRFNIILAFTSMYSNGFLSWGLPSKLCMNVSFLGFVLHVSPNTLLAVMVFIAFG